MTNDDLWREELSQLHAIIKKAGLGEAIKWGAVVYTHGGKNLISAGGFKNYFALWFYNGVFLKDSHNVLVNAQEGKTKALRQWRFTSKSEIDEKLILSYIQEAIQNEEQGKSWKPEKSSVVVIPEILADAIEVDATLKSAFDSLTPYKQKEYIEYVDTAKREETKRSRLEKIKPMIIAGIGLNDKYK